MTADPIDEEFPMRKRTLDARPTATPEWATEVESDQWSWLCKPHVDVSPFGTIELFQVAEESDEQGHWDLFEPAADVTESGVPDPAVCEAIAEAIERGDHSRIRHFLLWNDALDEGRNKAALHAYARGLRESAAFLRGINPNRERDFPEVWFWLGAPRATEQQ